MERVRCETCGLFHLETEPLVRLQPDLAQPETLRMTCADPRWLDLTVEDVAIVESCGWQLNRYMRRKLRKRGLDVVPGSERLIPFMVNQGVPPPPKGQSLESAVLNFRVTKVEDPDGDVTPDQ